MNKQPSAPTPEPGAPRRDRFNRIQLAIERGDYPNANDLAAEIEVTAKTIKKEIWYMRAVMDHKIEFDFVKNGYFYREKVAPMNSLHVTDRELTALHAVKEVVGELKGTFLHSDWLKYEKKLAASIPQQMSLAADKWKQMISVHTTIKPIMNTRVFEQLAMAGIEQQTLKMVYCKPDEEPSERLIDVYHLAKVNGEWYLFAYDHLRGMHKTFAPIRIRSLEPTGKTFERRSDFDIHKRLSESFGIHHGSGKYNVVIHFDKKVAPYIREKIWPCQQQQLELEFGGVELQLKVSSLDEVQRWMMTWGGNGIVVEPPELSEKVYQAAKDIVARYEARKAAAAPGA